MESQRVPSVCTSSLKMNGPEPMKVVLLGKTGAGKSSLANTIFGDQLFTVSHTINSETRECQSITQSVCGRDLTVIDTPGFFDTDRPERELKPEIVRCITECVPGPHAFLIVLKVEKFTEHEQAIIEKICTYFSNDILRYAVVVFTHGDQLLDGMDIEEFVSQNELVRELVKKCGERCHVIDNKYWNNDPKQDYRNNQLQVERLLCTIEKMVTANNGDCYTNDILRMVEDEIQQEEDNLRLLPGSLSQAEIRQRAKVNVFKKLLIRFAGIGTGVLLGAIFGVVVMVGVVLNILQGSQKPTLLRKAVAKTVVVVGVEAAGIVGTKVAGSVAALGGASALAGVTGTFAAAGAVKGGLTGYHAAEGAETPKEAAQNALEEVKNEAQFYLDKANYAWNKLVQPEAKTSQEEEKKSLLESQGF